MVTTISMHSQRCWKVQGSAFLSWYALSLPLLTAIRLTLVKDWWLTPELYLRRPPACHPEWRLDRVLKRKAEQGVKIYVVVYKEVRVSFHW
jgi:phospholipase D1/2